LPDLPLALSSLRRVRRSHQTCTSIGGRSSNRLSLAVSRSNATASHLKHHDPVEARWPPRQPHNKFVEGYYASGRGFCGLVHACSIDPGAIVLDMRSPDIEQQPYKPNTRDRSPSPALAIFYQELHESVVRRQARPPVRRNLPRFPIWDAAAAGPFARRREIHGWQ
jgi:hypothetical protein